MLKLSNKIYGQTYDAAYIAVLLRSTCAKDYRKIRTTLSVDFILARIRNQIANFILEEIV